MNILRCVKTQYSLDTMFGHLDKHSFCACVKNSLFYIS